MVAQYGKANAGGIKYYSLDNEPGIWSSTHFDIAKTNLTYDVLWNKTQDHAERIKEADSTAKVFGYVADSWCR